MTRFTHTHGRQLDLNDGEAVYRYDAAMPKPCVHPLRSPAGALLSGFEMSDHVWHRGLWFTFKFVNGTNFWEEHAPFGTQRNAVEPRGEFLGDGAFRLTHELDWSSEATGGVIRETRVVTFRDAGETTRVIDWQTSLLPQQDLTLDRTPYTTWGGYGGLSFRASRELHDASFETPAGTVPSIAGVRHEWMLLRAAVDGGAGRRVSIGAIDHPSNGSEPTPWYCKQGNGFTFWNAAILFHGPRELKKDAALNLRYRVVYRDGDFGPGEFAALADAFRNEDAR